MQTYAAKYPREVAGLVLVDSTAPENDPVSPPEPDAYSIVKHVSSLFGTTARLGLGRLLASTSYSELPPRYRDDARATATATATAATGEEMAGVLAEYGVASRSTDEAGTLRSLGAKPLIVLTATRGNREGWTGWQNEMADLSTNSVHRLQQGAAHAFFVDDPVHGASVTRAIHDVVAAVRTGAPLTPR